MKNRTPDSENKYKKYKNKLTNILRNCEKDYYSQILENHKNNIKETWKVLNSIVNKTYKNCKKCPTTFFENGDKLTGKNIADGFNNFFTNIGPELASAIPSQCNTINSYLGKREIHSMFLRSTNELEIMEIVRNFKSKTSVDLNGMSMALIKDIIFYVIHPLTYICNKSFDEGIFPDGMKIAKIIPIFKSGKSDLFTNYRPISLLPQFSKVLEKLFDRRFNDFISNFDILTESQYGFRSGRSTEMALADLVEQITFSLDNKLSTIGIFVDLHKAFDTINHNILLQKLEHYGFRGVVHNWLFSYLKEDNLLT